MTGAPPPWTASAEGVRLTVKVSPRSKRSEVSGIVATGDVHHALAIRLAAPPVDGAANEALCAFIAGALRVPKAAVRIRSGAGARIKQVDVSGDAALLAERLAALIAGIN